MFCPQQVLETISLDSTRKRVRVRVRVCVYVCMLS